jgi:hypothetical protein
MKGVLMQEVIFSIPGRAIRRCLLVLAVAAALAATLFVQPIAAGSPGIMLASGSFTLLGPQFGLPNGINRTFSFTVQQLPDGTIRGQAQVHTFAGNLVHVDVNCFALEGNRAIIGGTITFDSQFPEVVGSGGAFAIQDNPDVSTFFFGPGVTCGNLVEVLEEPDLATFLADFGVPITAGNIMIHQAN